MKKAERIYSLDLLRFLAAIMVVFFHYFFVSTKIGVTCLDKDYGVLSMLNRFGALGVRLFFMISGFVILMSAFNTDWKRFAVSRFIRLYPAYWICLSLTAAFTYLFGQHLFPLSASQFLINLTMFQEPFGVTSIDGVYWSLFVEWRFYFFVGLLLYLGWLGRIDMILIIWLAVTVFSKVVLPDSLVRKGINFVFMTGYSPHFIAGMVYYLIRQHNGKVKWQYGALLVVCILLAVFQLSNDIYEMEVNYKVPFPLWTQALFIIAFHLFFLAIATRSVAWLDSQSWLTNMGLMTYPLYLLHQNIGYIAICHLETSIHPTLVVLVVIIAMCLLSYFVSTRLEKPLANALKPFLLK